MWKIASSLYYTLSLSKKRSKQSLSLSLSWTVEMRFKSGLALDTLAVTTIWRTQSLVLTDLHVRYVHGGYSNSSSYGNCETWWLALEMD